MVTIFGLVSASRHLEDDADGEEPYEFFIENTNLDQTADNASTEGSHTGGTHSTVLTDPSADWDDGYYEDFVIKNITDGSQGTITSNTATTITVSILTGGDNNNWQSGDEYAVFVARPTEGWGTPLYAYYGLGHLVLGGTNSDAHHLNPSSNQSTGIYGIQPDKSIFIAGYHDYTSGRVIVSGGTNPNTYAVSPGGVSVSLDEGTASENEDAEFRIVTTDNGTNYSDTPLLSVDSSGNTEIAGTLKAEGLPINVKSYGAIGDGITDDTDAIQAAINAGRDVYFPPPPYGGTYKVTETLHIGYQGQKFTGPSGHQSQQADITFVGSATEYTLFCMANPPHTSKRRTSFNNLDIKLDASTDDSHVSAFDCPVGFANSSFTQVSVTGHDSGGTKYHYGFRVRGIVKGGSTANNNQYHNTFEKCFLQDLNIGIYLDGVDSPANALCNGNSILECRFKTCLDALYIHGDRCRVVNCDFHTPVSGGTYLKMFGSICRLSFLSNYCDGSSFVTDGIIIDSTCPSFSVLFLDNTLSETTIDDNSSSGRGYKWKGSNQEDIDMLNLYSRAEISESAAPATPPTDKVRLYVDSADGKLKAKFDTGTVVEIAAP
jgi:hypothetical protein